MGKFKALTTEQENEINELLELADEVLNKKELVLATASFSMGVSVLSSLASAITLVGAASGLSILGGPLFFMGVAGIGYFFGKEKKRKEVQKQKNYMHEITLKIAKIEEQRRLKEEEAQKQMKLKDEVIRQQCEKIEEYKCVTEVLLKVNEELKRNLSYA